MSNLEVIITRSFHPYFSHYLITQYNSVEHWTLWCKRLKSSCLCENGLPRSRTGWGTGKGKSLRRKDLWVLASVPENVPSVMQVPGHFSIKLHVSDILFVCMVLVCGWLHFRFLTNFVLILVFCLESETPGPCRSENIHYFKWSGWVLKTCILRNYY